MERAIEGDVMTRRDRERSQDQRRNEYQRDDQDGDRTPSRARVDSYKHEPNLPQIVFPITIDRPVRARSSGSAARRSGD